MFPNLLSGMEIRSYLLQEEIGLGGMAVVYRAYQPSVNRNVAMKIIRVDESSIRNVAVFRRRFAQEARVVASLEHIHILPIYDYGIEEDIAFIAMRYLPGGSLAKVMSSGVLSLDRAAELFTQIASGLDYAHRKGVIHRDVKPANILLDDEGNAYLTDFGLAKWKDEVNPITEEDTVVGTLSYISPEQLIGGKVDHRADIYSLGIILYGMLTGSPPFVGSSSGGVAQMLNQHINVTPRPPSRVNPDLPPGVDGIVLKALEKTPRDRYSSADEMAGDLNRVLGRQVTPVVSRPQILPRAEPSDSVGLRIMAITLWAILMLVAAASFVLPKLQQNIHISPQVLADQTGTAEDIVPTEGEVRQAQMLLGDGFVAYITCNQTSEYHATQAREVVQFADEYGIPVRVYDSDSDPYQQITGLEKARADGAHGFIVCLLEPDLMDEKLRSLQEAKMPLVLFNPPVTQFYGGIGFSQDEFEVGRAAGLYAGQIIRDEMGGTARVLILDYPSIPSLVVRANGIEAGIKELAPNAVIVAHAQGGTVENGKTNVARLITEGVAFDVIGSINDAGSFGAIEAMGEAEIPPDSVAVVSIDAETRARNYIRDRYFMRGSLPVDRELFSRSAVNAMVKLLAGIPIPESVVLRPGEMFTRSSDTP